jgi:hypothetical protein
MFISNCMRTNNSPSSDTPLLAAGLFIFFHILFSKIRITILISFLQEKQPSIELQLNLRDLRLLRYFAVKQNSSLPGLSG